MMRSGSASASMELLGDTLCVSGDLGPREMPRFEEALRRLIAHRGPSWVTGPRLLGLRELAAGPLEVDLSGVCHVSTDCARLLANAMAEAGRRGRSTVVLARKRALLLLQLAGVDRLGTIEFAD